ncbi:MAG: hypothetical protein JNM70_02200 [Anaerolineae bacterium]|nr:hypothetical protein [Anaerolineae bacterium]
MSYYKLLKQRLPDQTLLNCGRFNDTAISLHRRIVTHRLLHSVDCSFVWVGVNDLLVRQSPLFSRFRRWWARDNDEFRIHYRALLDLLTPHASVLITISPALLGEDPDSEANAALAELGGIIGDLTASYPNAHFLDLHTVFMTALSGGSSADYRPPHLLQGVIDALTLRSPNAVERISKARGLRLTLDNVHLNYTGAMLAADEFEQAILRLKRDVP